MEGSAALFITSWKRNSFGPANWKRILDFCENTLKKKPVEFSEIHCTVLDVDVGEEEKGDAARHSVTLIPATRPKLSHPAEDPPGAHWLLFHQSYYPGLGKLENINHVVALSSNVKETAAALQESLFPGAKFHPPPDQPSAAVFINEAWNKDALGLTGFHRTLVQDFCKRKAKAGETLKAYSTVLDVKISDDQKKDAENCGVTLIPAQRKEKADHRDDPPKLEWLLNHEIHYPDLREVEDVQYVIGYAPKTGRAAADIRRKLFPGAKLVLINQACPETNCLQAEEHGQVEFEERMLQMASEADILFSIGPRIYDYFENAYRAEVQGRDLSVIPHEEILPRPDRCFWVKEPKEKLVAQHYILTCGQMDTQNAIDGCKSIAASIGTVANRRKAHYSSHPEWKIQGVSEKAGKTEQKILADASESPYVYPKLQPGHSAKSVLTSLQQSHLCLPSPCYWDYSFYGMEAMTFGLPTSVHDDSHLAHFIMKHLKMHVDYCVVRIGEENLSKKISQHLEETPMAFKKAKALKTALTECEAITESFAKFASLLKEPKKKENEDDADAKPSSDIGQSSTQSTKGALESVNGKMSTLAVTKDDGIGSQAVEETHSDVMDKEDVESGQATTTSSVTENVKPNTEEAKDRNCNEEQQDCLVKVALDDEMLQKRLRELEELEAISVQLRKLQERKKNELKAAWRECQDGLTHRVQAVLADEESCNEVKKVCKEKVGLDPTTMTAESLGILLKILTLYYLYRVKQTCRYGSLAKALEPLLITDEMREIAAKVGITLQLKATYDKVKFEEIERFFINRDGGGVQPVTFHDEIEDDGHCSVDSEDEESPLSQQASDQVVVTASDQVVVTASDQVVVTASDQVVVTASDPVVVTASNQAVVTASEVDVTASDQVVVTASEQVVEQISQAKLEQKLEELIIQRDQPTQPITAPQESQARSLLPIKPSEQQLTDSDIRYLALAESKVQSLQTQLDISESKIEFLQSQLDISESKLESLQSQLQKACTEKKLLETQLAEALKEKSQFEKQCQEYMQRCHSAEKVVSTQLSDIHALTDKLEKSDSKNIEKLQIKLKEQNKVITELKTKLSQLSDAQSDIELQKILAESPQPGEQIITSETIHKEVIETSADDGYIETKIAEMEEDERPKPEMTGRDRSEMETATSTQPEMTVRDRSEMETATPTQPEMTVREGSEIETATPTQPEMTGMEGHGIKTEMVITAAEYLTEKKDSSGKLGKFIKRLAGRKEKTDGHWSRRTLKGHHQGQMFKEVRGLAFHNDKLLVCDSDNNLVHILNQDYTCEKELGSFSGQFAKPFKPQSIAVSQDNLYFILDYSNVQIVVCDQNNKVIRIITLPADSDPWCIALVKGFVIVTDVKGHRVLKYSQTGQYISEFGHRGNRKTQFNWPGFVAVNSIDVIMVSDGNSHCIKCFDTDLNYLYQYGHHSTGDSQLLHPYSIAIDGADHVYVCDQGNHRISIWSRDRTWIGHLFHHQVRYPWYMAVTADGDRIVVSNGSSDDIVVFSK